VIVGYDADALSPTECCATKEYDVPSFQNGDASIYYEEYGEGFPILTFAPAGLRSRIAVWSQPSAPIKPIEAFSSDFRVIVMDQRNAGGQSHAPITAQDSWHNFLSDHLALLDHLGIDQCHLYGQCIGGPFILSLLKAQPQRVASAVIAQPIGRVGEMPTTWRSSFKQWAETMSNPPSEAVLNAFHNNLYAPGFAYSVDRDFLRGCQTPCLVLAGNDDGHPFAVAEEIAQLLPHADFIPEWKEGQSLIEAKARVQQFLRDHTPVHA